MSDHRAPVEHSLAGFGAFGLNVCKHILNNLVQASQRSVDRSRFATLPLRALDDVGLTVADRDALLR
jgi:hypothetical protein